MNAFAEKNVSLKNSSKTTPKNTSDIAKQTLIHQSLVLSFEDLLTFTLHFARFPKVVCFAKKLIMVLSSRGVRKTILNQPPSPQKNGNLIILERSSFGVVCHGKSSMRFTHMPLPVLIFYQTSFHDPEVTYMLSNCLVNPICLMDHGY